MIASKTAVALLLFTAITTPCAVTNRGHAAVAVPPNRGSAPPANSFSQASRASQGEKPPGKAPAAIIDINQASAEDFVKLPGIGPKLARDIVVYRQNHGPYRRVEDLMVVHGIGLKKWRALRPYVRVGGGVKGIK